MNSNEDNNSRSPHAPNVEITANQQLISMLTRQEQLLADLAANFAKLSRTQFKANALIEEEQQRSLATFDRLSAELAARDRDWQERAQLYQQQLTQARAQMAADLLPVLDGIEAAIDNGYQLLLHATTPEPTPAPGLWARLRSFFCAEAGSGAPRQHGEWRAWLEGLQIVRDRFLQLLAQEDIHPLASVGESFDPRRHVAVETVERADRPAGTIAAITRKGYRHGERVLRYAEVTVTRQDS